MSQPIQFRGIDAVVQAYELNAIGPWAIICGKVVIAACSEIDNDDVYTGSQHLRTFLEKMKQGGTEGRYMLAVYRLSEDEDIDFKTVPKRGFVFTLYENEHEGSNSDNTTLSLLKSMNERLKKLEGGVDEDKTLMGKIGAIAEGIIMQPQVQTAIAMGAMNWANKLFKMDTKNQASKVAGVDKQPGSNLLDEAQIQKVHVALTRLSARDQYLGDHLLKLADIADNDPNKYSAALKFL